MTLMWECSVLSQFLCVVVLLRASSNWHECETKIRSKKNEPVFNRTKCCEHTHRFHTLFIIVHDEKWFVYLKWWKKGKPTRGNIKNVIASASTSNECSIQSEITSENKQQCMQKACISVAVSAFIPFQFIIMERSWEKGKKVVSIQILK